MTTIFIGILTSFFAILGVSFGFVWASPKFLNIKLLNKCMAIGGGFMLALVFFELFPHAMKDAGADASSVFNRTLAGILAVLLFDRFVTPRLTFFDSWLGKPKHTHPHDHAHPHVHCDHDGEEHSHPVSHTQGTHTHSSLLAPKKITLPLADAPFIDSEHHSTFSHAAACSAVGCLAMCSFFDGVTLVSALQETPKFGFLVFLGQILHLIPEALLSVSLFMAAGSHAKVARRASYVIALSFLAGGLLPFLFSFFSITLSTSLWLPFSCGIILFVTLSQLLSSHHDHSHDSENPYSVFGILLFYICEKLSERFL